MSSSIRNAMLAACVLGGCSDSALDITLVPDPERSNAQDLVTLVDRMDLVVDSADGLYPPGSERVGENFEIRDADGDPSDLELVADIPIGDRLPSIRLERGTLPDARVELIARGYNGESRIVATGGMSGAEFRDDIAPVALPFDLVADFMPLRVSEVFPSEGDMALNCEVSLVVVIFSRPVDPATVLAPGSVSIFPGSVQRISVDATGRFAQILPAPIAGLDGSVTYRLVIATSVTDASMPPRPLDQNASQAGNQPFDRTFRLECAMTNTPGMQACDPIRPEMGFCPGAELQCGSEGVCQSVCAGGVVCADECTPDGSCMADCRALDPVTDPCGDLRCDAETGRCM